MAIDWNKEITFSGRKKGSSKANDGYPEKTYMNLAVADSSGFDLGSNIPGIIILVVVVALIMKFGIFDFYARVDAKAAELAAQKQTLNAYTAKLVNYDEVLEEYQGYASISVSTEGLQVDALDALDLVDRYVAPAARVSTVSLTGDTLALNVTDVTLDGVGKLVSKLYEQDMVQNVSVSTAATQETASEDVTAALTITLLPKSTEGEVQ